MKYDEQQCFLSFSSYCRKQRHINFSSQDLVMKNCQSNFEKLQKCFELDLVQFLFLNMLSILKR
ncbi:unnamed protein product [Paramecium octaurelia]|uniref:Uncharacterized protein n=1 Tax=Paramecium octaurelia TaxID=43137 RepID=A0A8S1T3A0_PAROT|nr:unnamed protein product [Paramecium octaurelia]